MARHPANGGAHRRLGPARTVSSVYEPSTRVPKTWGHRAANVGSCSCAFELRVICLRLRPMTATPSVDPGRGVSTTARFIVTPNPPAIDVGADATSGRLPPTSSCVRTPALAPEQGLHASAPALQQGQPLETGRPDTDDSIPYHAMSSIHIPATTTKK